MNVQSWQEAFVASNVLGKEKDFFFLVDDAKPSCDFSETFLFFFFFFAVYFQIVLSLWVAGCSYSLPQLSLALFHSLDLFLPRWDCSLQ